MPNPWLRKNPFMSLFLSEANRMPGTLRSRAIMQTKRQINAAASKAASDNFKAALGAAALKIKRRR